MKRILILMLCCIAVLGACKKNADNASQAQEDTYLTAVDKYMTEIGSYYAPGEYTIPYAQVVAVEEADPENILVYGDFRVENYNQAGDTLKTVSGGSHPGLMHVSKTEDGYAVTQFYPVGDGADFEPTAKIIFDEYFDAFMAIQSDDAARKATREKAIADYVTAHSIPVSYYQDFGWPAEKIR
jgi:hypothetical protein